MLSFAMLRSLFAALSIVVFAGMVSSEYALAEGDKPVDDGGGAGDDVDVISFVELDAFTVTIFRNDLPAGRLTTRIVVELRGLEAQSLFAASKLKVRDAMFRELHRILEREEHNGPKVDLDLVKRRMLKVSRRQLGSDAVADVLVQALVRNGA